jgi:hypothetical protein
MDEYERIKKFDLPIEIQNKILELLPVLPPVGIHGKMNEYLLCQRVFEVAHFSLTHDILRTFLSKYYDLQEWDRVRTDGEQVIGCIDFELPFEMIQNQQELLHYKSSIDESDYDVEEEEENEESDGNFSSGYSDYEECTTPNTTNKYHRGFITGPVHSPTPQATRRFTHRKSITYNQSSPSTPSNRDLHVLSEKRRAW